MKYLNDIKLYYSIYFGINAEAVSLLCCTREARKPSIQRVLCLSLSAVYPSAGTALVHLLNLVRCRYVKYCTCGSVLIAIHVHCSSLSVHFIYTKAQKHNSCWSI